jgi:hypothetical protein
MLLVVLEQEVQEEVLEAAVLVLMLLVVLEQEVLEGVLVVLLLQD